MVLVDRVASETIMTKYAERLAKRSFLKVKIALHPSHMLILYIFGFERVLASFFATPVEYGHY